MVNIVANATSGTTYGSVYYSDSTHATDVFSYGNVYGNSGTAFYNTSDPTGSGGNVSEDPVYADVSSADPDDWDLTLAAGSPVLDAGDPSELDDDGSVCAIGAYGGADGGW